MQQTQEAQTGVVKTAPMSILKGFVSTMAFFNSVSSRKLRYRMYTSSSMVKLNSRLAKKSRSIAGSVSSGAAYFKYKGRDEKRGGENKKTRTVAVRQPVEHLCVWKQSPYKQVESRNMVRKM